MLINHGFQQPESEQFGTLWYGMVQAVRGTNGRFWPKGVERRTISISRLVPTEARTTTQTTTTNPKSWPS